MSLATKWGHDVNCLLAAKPTKGNAEKRIQQRGFSSDPVLWVFAKHTANYTRRKSLNIKQYYQEQCRPQDKRTKENDTKCRRLESITGSFNGTYWWSEKDTF